jgi:hypothetical protein
MFRPSPTPSFDEGPSFDSGIGMETNFSLKPPQVALPVPPTPSDSINSDSLQAQSTHSSPSLVPSDYAKAMRLQADCVNQEVLNGVRLASQIALPPSRPASVPSIRLNGHLTSATDSPAPFVPTPYPQRKSVERVEVEKVLGSTRGRKTPTLVNAPRLQWDLSRPFCATPSMSTLRDGEEGNDMTQSSTPLLTTSREEDVIKEDMRISNGTYISLSSPWVCQENLAKISKLHHR